ncbi:unnamed protein product [Pocillopora meandrina]|uniref:Uncharacterized protein n=1 Tax=Pocillopora meandrina TaxID=46732 RepID=A0AAU9WM82_9CNID|nr:unnamed protein product [Pocillopora meandrina]
MFSVQPNRNKIALFTNIKLYQLRITVYVRRQYYGLLYRGNCRHRYCTVKCSAARVTCMSEVMLLSKGTPMGPIALELLGNSILTWVTKARLLGLTFCEDLEVILIYSVQQKDYTAGQ